MAGDRPSQRYQLGGRIGGGGMAEVFEATLVGAEGFARPVAVKRIQPALSSDAVFGKMFVNEARIASLLHHANIAAVLDFDRDEEGRYFLVMELIRGVDLRRLMESGLLPVAISVHIAAEMLRGLDYAHELEHRGRRLGIVHRDVSPHNVMISWDGAVKLVDFGIAKAVAATGASRSGTVKGKVAYMSPEQASALELDGRTDIFAVGVVLHELLAGERLFRGSTEPEILARLLTQPIPRPVELAPHTPLDLDAVVMRMLERDRDVRYPTAHAALEALLATSATSPRAGLELAELLAARFPGESTHRRTTASKPPPDRPAPIRVAASPGSADPVSPLTATFPAPATPAEPAASRTASQPISASPIAAEPIARPRRTGRWKAAVLVAIAGGALATGVLLARRQQSKRHSAAMEQAPRVEQAASGEAPPGEKARPGEKAPPAEQTPSQPTPTTAAPPAPAPTSAASPPAGETSPASETERGSDRGRKASPGILDVAVSPWAHVTVDGVEYGQTPKKIPLSPGSHRVVLRNDELGKSKTVKVKIRSRETTPLVVDWQ
jgi:serine/threonine protein kinase